MYNYNRVRSMDNLNNTNYKSREEKRKYKEELAKQKSQTEKEMAKNREEMKKILNKSI